MKWFRPSEKVLTGSPTVNTLQQQLDAQARKILDMGAAIQELQDEIKKRVLISDIASLGRDVQEHGVKLEELTEAISKVDTEKVLKPVPPVNTLKAKRTIRPKKSIDSSG